MFFYPSIFDSVKFCSFPKRGEKNYNRNDLEKNLKKLRFFLETVKSKKSVKGEDGVDKVIDAKTFKKEDGLVLTLPNICDNRAVFFEGEDIYCNILELINDNKIKLSVFDIDDKKQHDLISYSIYSFSKTLTRIVDGTISKDELYISSMFPNLGEKKASAASLCNPKAAVLLGKKHVGLKYDKENKMFIKSQTGNEITMLDFIRSSFPPKSNIDSKYSFGYLTLLWLYEYLDTFPEKNIKVALATLFNGYDPDYFKGIISHFNTTDMQWDLNKNNIEKLIIKIIDKQNNDGKIQYKDLENMKTYFLRLFELNKTLTSVKGFIHNYSFFEDNNYSKSFQSIMSLYDNTEKYTKTYNDYFVVKKERTIEKKECITNCLRELIENTEYGTRSMAYAHRDDVIVSSFGDLEYTQYRKELNKLITHYIDDMYIIFNAFIALAENEHAYILDVIDVNNKNKIQIRDYAYSKLSKHINYDVILFEKYLKG